VTAQKKEKKAKNPKGRGQREAGGRIGRKVEKSDLQESPGVERF